MSVLPGTQITQDDAGRGCTNSTEILSFVQNENMISLDKVMSGRTDRGDSLHRGATWCKKVDLTDAEDTWKKKKPMNGSYFTSTVA